MVISQAFDRFFKILIIILFFQFLQTSIYSVYQKKTYFLPRGYQDQTSKEKNYVPVDIYRWQKCFKTILVLPGYRFHRSRWINKTRLKKISYRKGYCLILPEMGKSIYESRFFPESRNREFSIPSMLWINDIFLPYIQKEQKLLLYSKKNYLLGLSTGGRGVALVHLSHPNLFVAGAALSGDFDQRKIPKDRLMSNMYGPYYQFPQRWVLDNPVILSQSWNMHLYLSHGQRDKIVPYTQTVTFYRSLLKADKNRKFNIKMQIKNGSHDFKFWDKELDNVFAFFENFK